MEHTVDSLKGLNSPTGKYTHKLDSISGKQVEAASSLNGKLESLKSKSLGKITDLELSPELQTQADALTKNITSFQLPVKDFEIPSFNTPGNPLGNLDGLSASTQSPIGEIGNLKELPDIPGMPGEVGQLSAINDQAGKYGGDLKNLTQGNVKDLKEIPKGLENKAGAIAGLGDMQKQADGLLGTMAKPQSPEDMKQHVVDQAKKQAINHFAGKEEVLKQAMDKMVKLKSKYASLNSLKDVTQKRPNEMHGKSLRERILPGIALQIQKKGANVLVDFNPYAGYRLTGRIATGLGWNQRVGYNTEDKRFTAAYRIFGPRMYCEYKLGRGFIPRAEFEYMNTLVPPTLRPTTADLRTREWVHGAFIGLKKEYKFLKGVKGNAMIMVRVYNHQHKSPYNDVLNMRVGFEFPGKKTSKNKK